MAIETMAGSRAWIYSHNIGRNAMTGMGFSVPIGVAPAKDNVLFVASRGSDIFPNQRVSKVTMDQEFIGEFGRVDSEQGSHVFLTGVAVDQEDNVYTTDEWLNRVNVFDKDGGFIRTWGEAGEGDGQLNGPSGLAFDQDDNVVVINSLDSRVQRFSKDGAYLGGFGQKGSGEDELDMPWGITIDGDGDIYVADWNNHRVQKFSPDGAHLMSLGHGGSGPGTLRHPSGVAVDGDGDVYVVDWMNQRVAIYDGEAKPMAYLHGDAVQLSRWGQLSIEANPDMQRRRRQVYNLEEQQRAFRMPVACAFDREANRLIVCDSQRGRLQIYDKESNYVDPQSNL